MIVISVVRACKVMGSYCGVGGEVLGRYASCKHTRVVYIMQNDDFAGVGWGGRGERGSGARLLDCGVLVGL